MTRRGFLGLDLGTSSLKAVVLDDRGRLCGEASAAYPLDCPEPGWAQTQPHAWWQAAVAATRQARGAAGDIEVAAIGIDGQMHGLVLTDAAGDVVAPAMLWPDARAHGELARWRQLPRDQRAGLANPLAPGMTGPMLSWVRAHRPGWYRRTRWALLPKDWLRCRLTGIEAVATDPSDASATLLWDVRTDTWAWEVAAATGLDLELFPPARASDAVAGPLVAPAAAELGLPTGTPVTVGASDTAAGLLGTGVDDPAQVLIAVGSGAQLVRPTTAPEPTVTPYHHTYRKAGDAGWYAMAAVQNAGVALDRTRELLQANWDELYGSLERTSPGASQATFLPYLSGERQPNEVPAGSGGWVGLGLACERDDLLRAALEGVACLIHDALRSLPGELPARALLAGGGGRDPRFRQLLADMLQLPIQPVATTAASAVGAALLASKASGAPFTYRPEQHPDTLPDPGYDYTHVLNRFHERATAH